MLRKATRWRGPIGPALIAYLGGSQAHELSSLADPLAWALAVLGFPPGGDRPTNKEVTKSYRIRMRAVHPDHGGDRTTASKEILDLNAARRILSQTRADMTTLLLYPGAGSDSDQPSLVAIERAVAPVHCVRADFPYRKAGRQGARPGRGADGVDPARRLPSLPAGEPLVMGGRSMGGRMCSMVAAGADGLPAPANLRGLVLICYPLHPPGQAGEAACRPPAGDRRADACSSPAPTTRSASPTSSRTGRRRCPKAKVDHVWLEGKGHDLKRATTGSPPRSAAFVGAGGDRRRARRPRG